MEDDPAGTGEAHGEAPGEGRGDPTDWDRWQEIDTLFEKLLDLDPSAWEDALPPGSVDPGVRRTVLRLLRATRDPDASGPALPPGATSNALDALAEHQLPAAIGPFRPIRELGSGGMGTVYLAARTEGDFQQQVAVKVLRRGLDTDHLLSRFRAERRILARLRHPGVAHLVDGGSTPDGRPWLAMEYVDGIPLDAWCATQELGERDRVHLVREVADAVREVHRNLVVHRDIKPSNVLVTPEGAPKLLDFGIAKLLAAGDEADTGADDTEIRTRPGLRMLTPRFAAPEQRKGLPVTAATDVYQLGFLLEEILNGAGEVDPRAPGVRGDLRRVVAMATHEDPIRRYRDAGAFVEELDRWMEGRPVLARPDTPAYRATRFLQRNRWVGPTVVVGLLLLGGWAWSLAAGADALRQESDRALAAAERAQLEQLRAESATGFLVELFRSADPSGGERGDTLTARTLLTRGAERLQQGDGVDPVVGANLLVALSEVASSLAMAGEADSWFEAGLALAAQVHGETSAEVGTLLHARANHLDGIRDFPRAAEAARKALELRRALPGFPSDTLASNLARLSGALTEIGEWEAAREAAAEAVALHEVEGRAGTPAHLVALGQLAYAVRRAGDDAGAESQYLELLALVPAANGDTRGTRATVLNNLAQLQKGQGRLAEAEPLMREALEIQKDLLDPANRTLSVAYTNLMALLSELEHYDEALAVAMEHLDLSRSTLPEDHWRVGAAHAAPALLHERQGRWAEALTERTSALRIYALSLGPDHSWTVQARIRTAAVLAELGRHDQAAETLRAALESIPRIDDIGDPSALEAEARALEAQLAGMRTTGGES